MPRVLGGARRDERDEEDSGQSDDEDKPPKRDEFVPNPAVLRERAAARQQAKAQR